MQRRNHVDVLNRALETFAVQVPGLTYEVEVRVRARDADGGIIASRGWEQAIDPRNEYLHVAVVGNFPGTSATYKAPAPGLDERVEQRLRLADECWEFWLEQRLTFWSLMNRTFGPDGHWYWFGPNCQHPSRQARSRQWRVQDGKSYRSSSVVRLAWCYLNGPLPDGARLIRTCDDEMCDNPTHYQLMGNHAQQSLPLEQPRGAGILRHLMVGSEYTPVPRHEPMVTTKAMRLTIGDRQVIAQYRVPVRVLAEHKKRG